MRATSVLSLGRTFGIMLTISGCAEYYPYVDPSERASDYVFRHRLDYGEGSPAPASQRGASDAGANSRGTGRRDECNRLHDLARQPIRQALCYVDAKHDDVVRNINTYVWGHRVLGLAAFSTAIGSAATGIFGGSRDLAIGLGLGAASAYGLDSIANLPAYARTYWAGLRGLQCVRGVALDALGNVNTILTLRGDLIGYQRQIQRLRDQHDPRLSADQDQRLRNEFDLVFGRIRALLAQEPPLAAAVAQATDRVVSEMNQQIAVNEPSMDRVMMVARGVASAASDLGALNAIGGLQSVAPDPAGVSGGSTDERQLTADEVRILDVRLREIRNALPVALVLASNVQECRATPGENTFRVVPETDVLNVTPSQNYLFVVSGGQGVPTAFLTGPAVTGLDVRPAATRGAGAFELTVPAAGPQPITTLLVFQDQAAQNRKTIIIRIPGSQSGGAGGAAGGGRAGAANPSPPGGSGPPPPPAGLTAAELDTAYSLFGVPTQVSTPQARVAELAGRVSEYQFRRDPLLRLEANSRRLTSRGSLTRELLAYARSNDPSLQVAPTPAQLAPYVGMRPSSVEQALIVSGGLAPLYTRVGQPPDPDFTAQLRFEIAAWQARQRARITGSLSTTEEIRRFLHQ